MSDGRPAGGTARQTGNKTPRKVQWLDKDQIEPSHALDEHNRDPAALKELTDALERHKSEKKPAPRIHFFPPPRPDPRFPSRGTLPRIDTGVEYTHASSTNTTGSPVSSPGHSTPGSPRPETGDRFVPGNFIGAGETAGLPSNGNPDDIARESAKQVVRSHTRKRGLFGIGLRKRKGTSSAPAALSEKVSKTHTPVRSRDFATSSTPLVRDIESSGGREEFSRTGLGGGVLSALLTLYDEQNGNGYGSGYSTPGGYLSSGPSTRSSFDEAPSRPWVDSPAIPQPSVQPLTQARHESIVSTGDVSEASPSSPPESADPILPNKPKPSLTAKILKTFDLHGEPKRPIQARNAGGVVGSLIASSGNISGAAAPAPSQVQPNVKRPGFHLSRYSHDNLQELVKAKSTAPPPMSRPKSMQFEPGHLASGTSPESGDTSPTSSTPSRPATPKWKPNFTLKDFPSGMTKLASAVSTPASELGKEAGDYFTGFFSEKPEKKKETAEERKKRKNKKRREAEIYITRHVAEIMARQEFICKLARAMMMFGAPSHRLQPQIQTTARVLEIEMSCIYLPDLMLLSFDDNVTSTSNIKFIRQGSGLDLTKLDDAYQLYWKVIHDKVSVSEASQALDTIMRERQLYRPWQLCVFGGLCSASICITGFSGSFIDALVSFPMGVALVAIQLISVRNELYSNIFEISVATLFSFISAALATSGLFCYSALASSSVVLILPGFIVLLGSLELITRNLISGSVRLCYAVVYSLFLAFGLAMGAQAFEKISGRKVLRLDDVQCSSTHLSSRPWFIRPPSQWWYFLTVPMFATALSLRNFAPWNRRELPLLVIVASAGWVTNHFVSLYFVGQSDMSAAVGAFAVGLISNIYARFFSGNAFVVMITGILFQVPSGLGNGGLLTYVEQVSSTAANGTSTDSGASNSANISGFQTALQLISVAIGLAIGLSISLFVVHPIQSRRLRGGVFSL
ncbi:DUF1212-domain-containing protein [Flagelloscypha sp. PMI_526]|nr:DUF1212-domain-containing protein [Flagelloscypha sp. PMI_526]